MSQKAIVTVIKSRRTTKSGMIRKGTITIIKKRHIESGMAQKGIVAVKNCRIKGGKARKSIATISSIIKSHRIESVMAQNNLTQKVRMSKKAYQRDHRLSQSI